MRRALLSLAGVASASAAALPGSLVGVFLPGDNVLPNLAVVSIDPNSAANKTLAPASLGATLRTTFPAKSTKSADGLLVVTAATADGVYTFDTTSGESNKLAPLPAYNDSDPLIGLVTLPDGIYMLTQNALWSVADGAVTSVATFDALPPVAQVAVAPAAGTGGKPVIYVGDTESTALYAIDTGDSYAVSAVKTTISALWDLQYSAYLESLVAVAGYSLYTIDGPTGKTKRVGAIIDGPGYPKVNTLDPTGQYFAFFDFAKLHIIDLSTYQLLPDAGGGYWGAPRAVGFPVWTA